MERLLFPLGFRRKHSGREPFGRRDADLRTRKRHGNARPIFRTRMGEGSSLRQLGSRDTFYSRQYGNSQPKELYFSRSLYVDIDVVYDD